MDTEPTSHEELDPRLKAAIRGLHDREPERDLWPAIAGRIRTRRPGIVMLRWPVAAAAAVALVAATSFTTWRLTRQDAQVLAVADSAPTDAANVPVLPAGFDRAEASLQEAIAEVQRAYEAEAPGMDPSARLAIEQSLAALDSAIGQARTRAEVVPDDIEAARYLTRTMQRKLQVLRTAASMARSS
jgi:hypothetical protein